MIKNFITIFTKLKYFIIYNKDLIKILKKKI